MKPNILFIVIDGLRADKCHGETKTSLTPNIDSLIKNGIYFTQAISSSDATFTCIGSIFSAKYPLKNGLTTFSNHSKAKVFFDSLKDFDYNVYATAPDVSFWKTLTSDFNAKDLYPKPYVYLYGGTGQ
ncbi:MAG: sulfatase-like hydrolase/transferase [Crenarchaeota archaeon]|nr:sulfatase-like hydrolase/transferase [Thermoproteota archaeon]